MKLKRYFLLCFLFTISVQTLFAQTREITGTVTDASEIPLPGANILVQGTQNGTLTDFDGNFSIEAVPGDVLVISYVGYQAQEITLDDQTTINVSLREDTNALDEVVVVGYGTQKKSVVTGAISSVKAEDLESLPVNRIEQSLQGRTSGLTIAANSGQPGSASTIRVRGITSFGNNEPLWVVDGVIVDAGGIGYLNQSDIQSIEVLKDAASQAIYGARAAAGVVLVTTKKGKKGKLTVNYNGYMGLSGPARKLDLLNGQQYATIFNEKYANDYSGPVSGYNLPLGDPASYGEGTDWQDVIFNNSAVRQNHEVSLNGGNDVSTFYLSFGYLDQEGIVTKDISHYTRRNIRINSTHKISDVITLGQTLGYSNEKNIGLGNTNSEFGGPLSSAINLDPLTPTVVTDTEVANAPPYSSNPGIFRNAAGNPYGISNLVLQEMTNPLAYTETRRGNFNWADNFVGNVYVNLELLPGLNLKSTLGGKLAYYGYDSFTPVSYLNSSTVTSQNNITRDSNRGFGWNIENTLSYAKEINAHNFSILLGQGTYTENDLKGETVTYNNIPVTDRRDAAFFDVPDDQIIASAYYGTEHRVTSLFSRLNYNYDERYLFTGIIRRDGSTRFGSNNKYGWFPSFSMGWVPSKESFWNDNDIINQLKIRGGYGVVGSDAIGDFRYLSTIGSGRDYTYGNVSRVVIGNSPNAPANPDLKWEETHQTNIGFDSRLFNNVTLNFDYYNKKTVGILQDLRIPGYVGTGYPAANVADMVNRGFDIELGYNTNIGELNISANANLSYLENEVTYLGEDIDYISGDASIQSGNYPLTRTAVGESFNSFYGFQTNGIFQTQAEVTDYTNSQGIVIQPNAVPGDFKWVDRNDDGSITEADRNFLGTSIPKYTFGFTINMDYKNFDLLIFSQGAAGNKIFQGLRRLDITNANYQTEALGRWVGAGTSNDYPRLSNEDSNNNFSNPSDFYLEKGDYLRLKTVQIGYTLPQQAIEQVGLSKLRIYVTGENLVTFTKYTGFDPEIGGGVFGIDRGFYPQAITGLLGVNLQF